jgi:hypothetical protein
MTRSRASAIARLLTSMISRELVTRSSSASRKFLGSHLLVLYSDLLDACEGDDDSRFHFRT